VASGLIVLLGPEDQQEDAAHYLSEGVDALADDAKDEEAVNPVPWVKNVCVLSGCCARHMRRWCGHAVAFELDFGQAR
jgi:hypothetical protein